MSTPKFHFSNSSRMHDIKNTSHSLSLAQDQNHPHTHPQKLPLGWRNNQKGQGQQGGQGGQGMQYRTSPPLTQQQRSLEDELKQMKEALGEAVTENEFLRERVVELEALLAEALNRIEAYDHNHATYVLEKQRGGCQDQGQSPGRAKSL